MDRKQSWSKYKHSIKSSVEYHSRYHKAINNPVRRKILEFLLKGDHTSEEIASSLEIEHRQILFHLEMLEAGFCVEKIQKNEKSVYRLTKEGELIKFL